MVLEPPGKRATVVVYVTRPQAGAPDAVELLVEDDPQAGRGFRVPATPLRAGEHPCEAADRLVGELLAPATGGANVTFAYRKVKGDAAAHTFVTEAGAPLPDRIGPCRWVPSSDPAPWG